MYEGKNMPNEDTDMGKAPREKPECRGGDYDPTVEEARL
jgi:hypothetical protein